MLRGGQHGQNSLPLAVNAGAPSPAEHALAVLPEDLEAAILHRRRSERLGQLPGSTLTRWKVGGNFASRIRLPKFS